MIGIALLAKNPLASVLGIAGALALAGACVQTVRLAWSHAETSKQEGLVKEARGEFATFRQTLAVETLRVERDAARRSADEAARCAASSRATRPSFWASPRRRCRAGSAAIIACPRRPSAGSRSSCARRSIRRAMPG